MGLQLLTVKHRGKSGPEAEVGVGVRTRIVGVRVEHAGVRPIVPVPATVRHPLISHSRFSLQLLDGNMYHVSSHLSAFRFRLSYRTRGHSV